MKTRYTFHVKKIHIERSNDTWIFVLRNNSSFAILFITQALDLIYNGEPHPLKVFPTFQLLHLPLLGVYSYYSSVETILWNKPIDFFPSQSCINNIKSGTIATFYKYKQALWSYSAWKRRLAAQSFLPPHFVKAIPHVACRQSIFHSGHFRYTFLSLWPACFF